METIVLQAFSRDLGCHCTGRLCRASELLIKTQVISSCRLIATWSRTHTTAYFVIGNHAFAILCGKECYESLGGSFKELFEEINSLIAEGEIEIDGEKIQLEFYLGGDYKVECIWFFLIFGINVPVMPQILHDYLFSTMNTSNE